MAQTHEVGKHATTVSTGDDGKTRVTYHSTDVVVFDADVIRLDTGGWFTVTTKTRMNQASSQFGLGYGVYQRKGLWYVEHNGITHSFGHSERIELNRKAVA